MPPYNLYGDSPQYASTVDDDSLMNNPLINNFATRGLLSGVQWLGETLGKPQAALFGAATGDFSQLANLIPFSDTLGITNTGDPNKGLTSQRVGGRDLLRHYGLVDKEDNYGNFAGGLALDVLADPLAFVRGPLGALTKAGEAAQKGAGTARTIAGRMKAGEGGLFSIANKPWYMEMLPGAKKAENVFVAGVDDFGKKTFQGIAQGMDTGWSKATRWTVPGTDFSPVAWLRSAYEKGAGNVTGYAPIVDEQARTLAHDTRSLQTAAREAAFPLQEEHARTLDKLMPIIGDQNQAEMLMSKAGVSRRDTGVPKIPEGTPPEAVKVLTDWAEAANKHMEPIYGKAAVDDLSAHGIQVNESSNIWNHEYHHRQQAGMGDSFGSQQMAREPILTELPGGTDQIERIATSKFSGAYSKELDPVKQAAIKEEFKAYLHKEVLDEGNAQISKNWDRFRSLGNRGSTPAPVYQKVAGQLIDTPQERVLKGLEAEWGLTPKDQFAPDTVVKARAKGWGGEHKFTPAGVANATEEDIALMRDRKGAERAMEIVANPKERDKLVDRVADYFLNADPAIAERGYFYHQDLGTGARSYGEHMAAQKAMNTSIMNVLGKEAEPIGKLRSAASKAGDVYTLNEAIEKLDMKGAEEMLRGRAGLGSIEDLDTVGVPKKLVDNLALEKAGPKQTPEGWISKLTSATRYGLTVPWPANLFRNVTGETANIAASGTNPLKGISDSISFFNKTLTDTEKLTKAQATNKAGIIGGVLGFDQNRELIGTGVTKTGGLAVDVAPKQAARSKWDIVKDALAPVYSEKARADLGITPFRELFNPPAQPVAAIAGAVGETVTPPATASTKQWILNQIGKVVDPVRGYAGMMENLQHFQNNVSRHQQLGRLIEEGFSPEAAANRVLTTQRDYMNITPFEKRFMKNAIPFYSFAKQNLISQADMLSREPGRYNAILSLLNSGRESGGFVPGYASSGTAIPLPGAPEGQQRFLGSLGLTQEDEMMSALASFAGMRFDEGARKLASGSNPALKMLFERATGTQVFSGRKLDDLQPGVIPSLLTGGEGASPAAARFLSSLASGTPAARMFSTVDRLANIEKRGPLDTLLNLTTGIRTIDVDQQAASQIAARDTITKLLNQSDQYKLRDQLVVEPSWKGREQEMPPEIAELFRQYQWLQQQGKEAVKQKQLAGQR